MSVRLNGGCIDLFIAIEIDVDRLRNRDPIYDSWIGCVGININGDRLRIQIQDPIINGDCLGHIGIDINGDDRLRIWNPLYGSLGRCRWSDSFGFLLSASGFELLRTFTGASHAMENS